MNERTPPIDWLLDSDPAIRWQVMRDLTDAPDGAVAAERARVASEGWGAQLLAARDPDGQWMGGACFPGRGGPPAEGSQPWTSTLPAMMELYDFGLDPTTEAAREMTSQVAANCRWEYDGAPFFDGEVEPCINGRTVTLGAYFGADVSKVVARLLADQLADGGWNCWTENGATVSSFHSTICVLEGLLEYERARGGTPETRAARRGGEEYLLDRSLFRRRSTGEVADDAWLTFSFPTRWHYDVLRGLEYFRAAGVRDPRLGEAIEVVRSKRRDDGTWLLENTHPGAVHFRFEGGDGRPSRWNTLRASRVLDWWDRRG
ncbi:hypothetical protein SAMN05421678_102286 [Actinopolymorpha cephalotaxi]|uniref:Squalene cyclase n=1 Tax=Actinopolymorpha cephalotaxi TaxID=504797 RepID=A0A1I2LSF1_9ACTN|nr:hypothetical protein [Actinopolymorpha cephalotaxi]NYH81426.1 hypothetical protein [Actinopolymorpha cephalotaxi]SFF82043.1 hypothetical protein SAMN05421678_102286 [Actinopolymorpha cephalotaxi]